MLVLAVLILIILLVVFITTSTLNIPDMPIPFMDAIVLLNDSGDELIKTPDGDFVATDVNRVISELPDGGYYIFNKQAQQWHSLGGAGGAVKFGKVTAVPSVGGKAYTGRLVTYSTTGTPPSLAGTVGTEDIYFCNILESSTGTPFLVLDDVVALLATAGAYLGASVYVCEAEPRGYL